MALDKIRSRWVYYDPLFTLKFNLSRESRKIRRHRRNKKNRESFRRL